VEEADVLASAAFAVTEGVEYDEITKRPRAKNHHHGLFVTAISVLYEVHDYDAYNEWEFGEYIYFHVNYEGEYIGEWTAEWGGSVMKQGKVATFTSGGEQTGMLLIKLQRLVDTEGEDTKEAPPVQEIYEEIVEEESMFGTHDWEAIMEDDKVLTSTVSADLLHEEVLTAKRKETIDANDAIDYTRDEEELEYYREKGLDTTESISDEDSDYELDEQILQLMSHGYDQERFIETIATIRELNEAIIEEADDVNYKEQERRVAELRKREDRHKERNRGLEQKIAGGKERDMGLEDGKVQDMIPKIVRAEPGRVKLAVVAQKMYDDRSEDDEGVIVVGASPGFYTQAYEELGGLTYNVDFDPMTIRSMYQGDATSLGATEYYEYAYYRGARSAFIDLAMGQDTKEVDTRNTEFVIDKLADMGVNDWIAKFRLVPTRGKYVLDIRGTDPCTTEVYVTDEEKRRSSSLLEFELLDGVDNDGLQAVKVVWMRPDYADLIYEIYGVIEGYETTAADVGWYDITGARAWKQSKAMKRREEVMSVVKDPVVMLRIMKKWFKGSSTKIESTVNSWRRIMHPKTVPSYIMRWRHVRQKLAMNYARLVRWTKRGQLCYDYQAKLRKSTDWADILGQVKSSAPDNIRAFVTCMRLPLSLALMPILLDDGKVAVLERFLWLARYRWSGGWHEYELCNQLYRISSIGTDVERWVWLKGLLSRVLKSATSSRSRLEDSGGARYWKGTRWRKLMRCIYKSTYGGPGGRGEDAYYGAGTGSRIGWDDAG
jgi:hypothetical protein